MLLIRKLLTLLILSLVPFQAGLAQYIPPLQASLAQTKVIDFSIGSEHKCAITQTSATPGAIYCWGKNYDGQLGIGSTSYEVNEPALVDQTFDFINKNKATKVVAGSNFTLAIVDGKVYSWGDNSYGQLGIGENVRETSIPSLVLDMSTKSEVQYTGNNKSDYVVDIETGDFSSCAITKTGRLYCWGENSNNTLGLGDKFKDQEKIYIPQPVLNLKNGQNSGFIDGLTIKKISLKGSHFCAISKSGRLFCLENGVFQKVHDPAIKNQNSRTGLLEGMIVTDIDSYDETVCAINAGHKLFCNTYTVTVDDTHDICGGYSFKGQCVFGGIGKFERLKNTSQYIWKYSLELKGKPLNMDVKSVSVGNTHICFTNFSNQLLCVGNNTEYQHGHEVGRFLPGRSKCGGTIGGQPPSSRNSATIFIAGSQEPILVDDGKIFKNGKLVEKQKITKLISAESETCAIDNKNNLYCWGGGDIREIRLPGNTGEIFLECYNKEEASIKRIEIENAIPCGNEPLFKKIGTDCQIEITNSCSFTGILKCDQENNEIICITPEPITEICDNGIDDNCNGLIDEGCHTATVKTKPSAPKIVKTVLQSDGSHNIYFEFEKFDQANIANARDVNAIKIAYHYEIISKSNGEMLMTAVPTKNRITINSIGAEKQSFIRNRLLFTYKNKKGVEETAYSKWSNKTTF